MDLNFDKLAQIDQGCIKEIKEELNFNSYHKAGNVLSVILHSLRNSFTYHQSAKFIEHLSKPLKLIYIQNWRILPQVKPINRLDDLVQAAMKHNLSHQLWKDKFEAQNQVFTVIRILHQYVDLITIDILHEPFKDELQQICVINS